MIVRRDVGEQRTAGRVCLHQVAHAAHDHVAGEDGRLGAVGEAEAQHAPVFDIDRIGLDIARVPPAVRPRVSVPTSQVTSATVMRSPRACASTCFRCRHGRKRMAALADQRAATGHRPLRRMCGMRAAMALLRLHEQNFVPRGAEDFRGLRHRRGVDPVLRIEEQPAARADGGRGLLHLLHHAFDTSRAFGTCRPIGSASPGRPK